MARQRLGQHFLADSGWREKIARVIGVSFHGFAAAKDNSTSCWIEVGAGHGEMTQHLARVSAPVYAIEIDEKLVRHLRVLVERFPNLTVVHADVLKTDLAILAGEHKIRIYGNLPYYITSPILHHFFRFANRTDEIHIVIQREVAFRLVARPGTRDYGYLSVLCQYFSRPAIALRIPRGAFRPPPEVGSVLVSMKLPGALYRVPTEEESLFFEFVKRCFAQKRKTLVNNLRPFASPEEVREFLTVRRLQPATRAEELTIAQLVELYGTMAHGRVVAG